VVVHRGVGVSVRGQRGGRGIKVGCGEGRGSRWLGWLRSWCDRVLDVVALTTGTVVNISD
jgi:hypothetical protein